MVSRFSLVLTAVCSASCAQAPNPALAVYERTKTVTITYAAYYWNWGVSYNGSRIDEWSAEFHSGALHRVETPTVRIIADCAAQTGTMLNIASRERITGPRVAGAACGINANRDLTSLHLLGRRNGSWGEADMLGADDNGYQSRYAVSKDGIIIAQETIPESGNETCLQMVAMQIVNQLPSADIFTEASLEQSFVGNDFRTAPTSPDNSYWTDGRTCSG